MKRIRFLTAMAVGCFVTEGLETDEDQPDCLPYLIWEWLVIEAMVRTYPNPDDLWAVPGSQVTKQALANHGYLDYRSYLKTPRIFGFHGVYKRLAIHLGLVDLHICLRPGGEILADSWARDLGYNDIDDAQKVLKKWRDAVQRGLASKPCKTCPVWKADDWSELAVAFFPNNTGRREKKVLKKLLHKTDERALGALPAIWALQKDFVEEDYSEETLHTRLKQTLPSYCTLLKAIATYEDFSRGLQDAFDLILASGDSWDGRGLEVSSMANEAEFVSSLDRLDNRYEETKHRLGEVDLQMAVLFDERFGRFAMPVNAEEAAKIICEHHEEIQKRKSADGKRAWFDRLGPNHIYIRNQYRKSRREMMPDRYVHDYRGRPIRNFYFDLDGKKK